MAEVIGMIVGAALTILIFFYLLGDLPVLGSLLQSLYRLALHIFIGAVIGYSTALVMVEVLFKMVFAHLRENPALAIPVFIGLGLLVFKSIRRLSYIGNLFMAPLLGAGIGVALGGAFLGTLVPQVQATAGAMRIENLLEGLLIVGGTICTLMVFNFTSSTQRQSGLTGLWHQIVGVMAGIGRWFLLVTLGVAFAGALTASLAIFIGRIQYLIDVFVALAL